MSPEQETLISRIFTGALGACLLAALAALIYVSRLDPGYTGARYVGDRARPGTPQPQPAPSEPQAQTPPVAAVTNESTPARPQAQANAKRAAHASTVGKRPAQPAAAASSQPAELREVEVTMYATPWCDICDRARDFLLARDVTLIEYDIDRDPAAARRLAKLNPGRSVPTFVIAGRAYVGFSPWEVHDALRDAAREHDSAQAPVTAAR